SRTIDQDRCRADLRTDVLAHTRAARRTGTVQAQNFVRHLLRGLALGSAYGGPHSVFARFVRFHPNTAPTIAAVENRLAAEDFHAPRIVHADSAAAGSH